MGALKLASIFHKDMKEEIKTEVKVTFHPHGKSLRSMVHFYLNERGQSVLHGRYFECGNSALPRLQRQATYHHGMLNGSVIDYDSKGRKSEEGIYQNGVLVGNKKYNADGEVVSSYENNG